MGDPGIRIHAQTGSSHDRPFDSWAGPEIVGSGFGRNYTWEALSDGWHIDIEVSGRFDVASC
ncbi:MAG: hypothetical protein ACUVS2_09865 [Candidatus Flexifilum sp.]|jgi:hypothetical protein